MKELNDFKFIGEITGEKYFAILKFEIEERALTDWANREIYSCDGLIDRFNTLMEAQEYRASRLAQFFIKFDELSNCSLERRIDISLRELNQNLFGAFDRFLRKRLKESLGLKFWGNSAEEHKLFNKIIEEEKLR